MNQQFAILTKNIITILIGNQNGISERKLLNDSIFQESEFKTSPTSFIQFLLVNGDITLYLEDGEVYYKAANHYLKAKVMN